MQLRARVSVAEGDLRDACRLRRRGSKFCRVALTRLSEYLRRWRNGAAKVQNEHRGELRAGRGRLVRATLPGMPSVVTAGVSREDALEMAVDALMQLLAVDPERQAGGDY